MPQRALLFSSDPETSRRLAQALRELEFSVDHCPEIFAAVERITSHSFELIVTDWDDGVEAMFLIKTARELRLNCDAFRIVVAKPAASAAALQAGAQMVVPKPVLPGHTKYALLTSDDFVRRMKNWVPVMAPGLSPPSKPATHPAPAPPAGTEPPQAQPRQAPRASSRDTWMQQSPVAGQDESPNLSFASLDGDGTFFRRLGIEFDAIHTKVKPRLRLFLWATLLATGVSTGYVFSGTFKAQASSGVDSSALPLSLSAGAATAPAPPLLRASSKLTIRVTPERTVQAPEPQIVPAESVTTSPAATAEPVEEAVAAPPASLRPSIPASLTVPLQPELGARTTSAKAPPSLMSSLEPVSLTEDLAEKMLVQRVLPDYPAQALQSKLQGAVLLQIWIRKDGTVRDLEVANGPLLLCGAAYNAVKQWRYKPFQMNGQSVEAKTYVTVNFRLP
jgi:TonB family protein